MAICDTYLDQIEDSYNTCWWIWDVLVEPHSDWLLPNYSSAGFTLTWRTHVALAICNMSSILERLILCNPYGQQPERIPYVLKHCVGGDAPEEYELTAEKICEAWAADDFAGRTITIAFLDRMRQLLWNEPYYVKWAARPEA